MLVITKIRNKIPDYGDDNRFSQEYCVFLTSFDILDTSTNQLHKDIFPFEKIKNFDELKLSYAKNIHNSKKNVFNSIDSTFRSWFGLSDSEKSSLFQLSCSGNWLLQEIHRNNVLIIDCNRIQRVYNNLPLIGFDSKEEQYSLIDSYGSLRIFVLNNEYYNKPIFIVLDLNRGTYRKLDFHYTNVIKNVTGFNSRQLPHFHKYAIDNKAVIVSGKYQAVSFNQTSKKWAVTIPFSMFEEHIVE